MRKGLILLVLLLSVGCARLQQVLAPDPGKTATAETAPPRASEAAPVAADAPQPFECSDGTMAPSFTACQINMARTRLPPSEQGMVSQARPADRTGDVPTGSVR
jgi:hypothetical protein